MCVTSTAMHNSPGHCNCIKYEIFRQRPVVIWVCGCQLYFDKDISHEIYHSTGEDSGFLYDENRFSI